MKGGNLDVFELKNNHFIQTLEIQYEYQHLDKLIQYTPHAFKHLDGWVPFGHPMWQYYSGMTITQAYKKKDIPQNYKQKLLQLCPYVQEMIDKALSGHGYDRISDPSNRRNYNKEFDAYPYKINGIFMWVKFSEENPDIFFISHICPLGVANPNLCSYRDPAPNVSEAIWYGNYKVGYTDIVPYSDITRQAFANICGDETRRGYAICRDVYIESLRLLTIDIADRETARIAKEAADEIARIEAAKKKAEEDDTKAKQRAERLEKEALEKAAAAEATAAAAAEAKAAAEAAEAAEAAADSPLRRSHFDELYKQLQRVASPKRKAAINRLTQKMSYRRIPIPDILPKNVHDGVVKKSELETIKTMLKPYRTDAGKLRRTRRALRARRRTRVV
jgi:hypothetical protein